MSTADRVRILYQKDLMTFDFSTMTYPLRGDYLDDLRVHYDKFIHPIVPIGAVILYLTLSKPLCDFIRFVFGQQKGQNGPIWSQSVKYFTALHSLILAVYSG